jgi:2-iminobutanoate/2-iminopropanoate deaminase
MTREVITSDKAAGAIGPYSLGIKTQDLIFASGTIGKDPASGELAEGVAAQTRQALMNLGEVLTAGGSSLSQVVKTTVFLTDLAEFANMNEVYAGFFGNAPPARSTIQVAALPGGALVEIEAIALR